MADPLMLVLATWLFPGVLVHAFGINGHEPVLLCWLKPPRLILDVYDTSAGSLQCTEVNRKLERDAIASADGIIHRDLRIKRLQRLHGYTLPAHNLFMYDPLPEFSCTATKTKADKEIHVVSSGWVGSGDNSIMRVAHALCSKGIHLHVYFNPFQTGVGEETKCYWDLQKNNPYFHIESPVFGEAYLADLARYDFGLSINEPSLFGEKLQNVTNDAMSGCGSSRVADYITTGLGVIVSPELSFISFWSRHFALVTVPASLAFLQDPLPALRQALTKKANRTVVIDRTSISIRGSANRLSAFYQRVIQGKVVSAKPVILSPAPLLETAETSSA